MQQPQPRSKVISGRPDGVGASADAVARFQHVARGRKFFQRPRGAEAGGARTDDGDVDFEGRDMCIGEW